MDDAVGEKIDSTSPRIGCALDHGGLEFSVRPILLNLAIPLHQALWTQTEQRLYNAPSDVSQPLNKDFHASSRVHTARPIIVDQDASAINVYVCSGRCMLRDCTLTQ